jgi:hypothetical protein
MLGALAPSANAQFAAVGLPDPIHHFPSWVSDSNGIALELCANTALCLASPIEPNNAWSALTGFGVEAFYHNATAISGKHRLVLALEASYFPATPADGNQFLFARTRIRLDPVVSGASYQVVTPWNPQCGPITVTAPVAGGGGGGGGGGATTKLDDTTDQGGGAPFTAVLQQKVGANIGPFISWNTTPPNQLPPPGYIGNPGVTHTVTGAVCPANNVFSVVGPGINFSQPLFAVQGKIYNPALVPPALVLNRATYDRTGTATRVNVFAESPAVASLTLASVMGELAGPMTSNTIGDYYRQVNGSVVPPATVTVSATTPGALATPTVRSVPLTDAVVIDPAVYNIATQTLVVTAHSSDKVAPPVMTLRAGPQTVTMTATTPGDYTATVVGLLTPPPSIKVTSSKGGYDNELIKD